MLDASSVLSQLLTISSRGTMRKWINSGALGSWIWFFNLACLKIKEEDLVDQLANMWINSGALGSWIWFFNLACVNTLVEWN